MNAAQMNELTEHLLSAQQVTTERAPVAERLESALGGELSRFLLTALVGALSSARDPR
jgi:hypothetical protein